jgi:DNA recombination protein RmuC
MDAPSLLSGLALGAIGGAVAGFVLARSSARAQGAADRASLEQANRQLAETQRDIERSRGALAESDRKAADAVARLAERERAHQQLLAERERSLEELKAMQAQAREALREAFQATGAEVLKQAGEQLAAQARRQFEDQRKLTQQEIDERRKAIDATVTPLREQLVLQAEMVKQLDLKREGDTKTLGEQLRMISELQQKASSAAQSLAGALRDNRQRGRWGEISLRNVVEMAGLSAHVDFSEQASLEGEDGRLRPDMTVNLPGGRQVPIDSKVPMNAYFDSLDTALADSERATRRQAHVQALRTHVRTLGSRAYAKALDGEVDFTVLFVPIESALMAALEADPALYPEALENGVVIATPGTLLVLLRTFAMHWQQAALAENARLIGERASELLDRIGKFAEHLQGIGKGLETAVKSYNQSVGSFNTRLLPGAKAAAELTHRAEALPEDVRAVESAPRGDVAQLGQS